MKDIFKTKTNCYNTLNSPIYSKRNVKTVRYGLQTMSYMGPKIWDLVPKEMKQVTTLNEFKAKFKIWKLENCLYQELTLKNLPSTDRIHHIMPFNAD